MQFNLYQLLGSPPGLIRQLDSRARRASVFLIKYLLRPGAILAAMAAVTWLVHATGGIKYVYAHLMYLPLMLAAHSYGFAGGLAAAVLAGLALGPFMPINTETGETQNLVNWLTRMALFSMVAGLAGLLFQNLRKDAKQQQSLLDSARKTLRNVLRTFSAIITARDQRTGGHSMRVAHNAYSLGRQMGLAPHQMQELYWAGLLHDIGKVWIPDNILQKPGKLSSSEYAVMKKHAPLGESLLRKLSPVFRSIAKGVGQHHERWDGNGYPKGLPGEKIHIYARILSVADVFEALTTKRPYRDPMTREEATNYIKQQSGILFDPIVVAAFVAGSSKDTIQIDGEGERWSDPPMDLDEARARASMLKG